MNSSWSQQCAAVTQLFVFLMDSVSQPSWEQLIVVAPESTLSNCKGYFRRFPAYVSALKCPHISSSEQVPSLAGGNGVATLVLLCDFPVNVSFTGRNYVN